MTGESRDYEHLPIMGPVTPLESGEHTDALPAWLAGFAHDLKPGRLAEGEQGETEAISQPQGENPFEVIFRADLVKKTGLPADTPYPELVAAANSMDAADLLRSLAGLMLDPDTDAE